MHLLGRRRRRRPPQAAWYALREAYRPRLLTFQPAPHGLDLVVVNDTDEAWQGTVEVSRLRFDGDPAAVRQESIACPARGVRRIPLEGAIGRPERPEAELLRAVAGEERAEWFFLRDRELAYPAARFTARTEADGDGWLLEVTARTLLRDLWPFPDRLHPSATADGRPATLLPGETARFAVRSNAPLRSTGLANRPVLRCVNDIDLARLGPAAR